MLKKKELDTKLFVIFSLSLFSFVLVLMFIAVLKENFREAESPSEAFAERYHFREMLDSDDPYISRVPDFAAALAGPIISESDPIKGDKTAKVAITIFSDFACSFCYEQEKIINRALEEFAGRIMVVWKDFPETDENSPSYQAALAGRCAQLQGRFWDYHDWHYEQFQDWSSRGPADAAGGLGLKREDFENCLRSSLPRELIRDNIEEAYALDIKGVPFMYVNNQEVFGRLDYEDLKRLIEIELR